MMMMISLHFISPV